MQNHTFVVESSVLLSKTKKFLWKVGVLLSKTNGLGHPPDPVSSTAARDPPTTRAGGQDDGSYTKLPQNNDNIFCQ